MSSNEWRKYKLEEIAEIIGGGTPSTTNPDFWGEEIPWVTPRDLASTDERFISCGERNITKKGLQNSSARLLPAGTVLLTTRAPIGYLRIALNPICTNQGFKSLIPKADIADNQFLFYLLKNNVEYLKSVGVGTTFAEISGSALRQIEFQFPPLSTQRRIAEILSALDDKIELNRQTNATLEAIAQAIFKEWFINFNFPGSTGEMVESELGMIPKGWRVGKLGDVCKLIKGVSYKSSELQHSDSALVTLKSINRGGGFNNDGFKEYLGTFKTSQCLKEGDLIFAQTDITQNADVVGSPAIVENPFNYKNLVASLDIVKCEHTNEMPSSGTLYYFLQRQEFKDYCLSQTNGSTVLHLRSSEVPNYLMIIPYSSILREFNSTITPIRQIILENNRQNQILREIRDELLPKLMNGEIEV